MFVLNLCCRKILIHSVKDESDVQIFMEPRVVNVVGTRVIYIYICVCVWELLTPAPVLLMI